MKLSRWMVPNLVAAVFVAISASPAAAQDTDVPGISVSMTAGDQPTEPSDSVTYTIEITNLSAATDPVTVTALVADVFGDLFVIGDDTNCDEVLVGAIAPGGLATCSFTKTITRNAGDTHTNTVTATVVDDEGIGASDSDDEAVTFADAVPLISVSKTALNQPFAPEDRVTYVVEITNQGGRTDPVTVTALDDDEFGDVFALSEECFLFQFNSTILPGTARGCSFSKTIFGSAGDTQTSVVTATVADDEGTETSNSDDETVTFTSAPEPPPVISVSKTAANQPSAPSDSVTYNVQVTNQSALADPVTVAVLSDNVFGDLFVIDGDCPQLEGLTIAPGDTAGCSFTETISGSAGDTHTNVVTATVVDDEGAEASASDEEVVTFTPIPPPPNAGEIQFGLASFFVNENGRTITITVTRTSGAGAVGVHYATANDTATADTDYTAVSGTLSWADGDTSTKAFTVSIRNDKAKEGNETLFLLLDSPTGGATLGVPNGAVLTIVDDEKGGGGKKN